MSDLDLKFGSVSNSPASQQQSKAGSDQESPVQIRSGAMSGGANPPKNLGQNVTKMTFGDIEVKAETSPKAEFSKPSTPGRGNFNPGQYNNNNNYRGNHNYEHRQHRNSSGGYANNNMHYNNRGPKGAQNQQYMQPGPQMMNPYVYAAAAAATSMPPYYYAPPVHQYPLNLGAASPYSPPQHTLGEGSPKHPGSPSVHNSPLQRTPQKAHATIRLSDPVTHQPIDLKATSRSTVSSPAAAYSVPAATAPVSHSPVPSPIVPAAVTISSPASTASPKAAAAETSSAANQTNIAVRNQLKEKIRLRLEEERRQKDKLESEQQAKEAAEKAAKEAAEKEAAEKAAAEKAAAEKAAADKAAAEKAAAEKAAADKAAAEKAAAEKAAAEEAEKAASEKAAAEKAAAVKKSVAEGEANQRTSSAPAETEEKIVAAIASVNSQLKQGTLASSQYATEEKSGEPVVKRPHPARNFASATRPVGEELSEVSYPDGIEKPKTNSSQHRYKYDNDFLFQFQPVVVFPPLENWAEVRALMDLKPSFGGQSFGRGFSRTPSAKNLNSHNQQAMGSFGSSGPGYRDRSASGPGGFHNMGPGGHGGKNLSRINSSNNLGGRDSMGSRSGRQGSRRGKPGSERSGSNRDHHDDHNSTAAGRNPEIVAAAAAAPLKRAENAWVPRVRASKGEEPASIAEGEKKEDGEGDGEGESEPTIKTTSDPSEISETVRMAPDMVQRKVKSFLNKMTLDNFDRITVRIMEIATQSKYETDGRTLRQIIELTFAKAVDEAHWSSMYAKFCYEMTNKVDPGIEDASVPGKKGGPLFRKYLLGRCQEEFERGWSDKLPANADGSPIDTDVMSDEYYQAVVAKRRGLGLIRFIGELYILGLLSDKIINSCIIKLCSSNDPSEEVIESLCKLMSTVGRRLDDNPNFRRFVDRYMDRMYEIQQKPGLPSRLKFMLMDVQDLRKNKWLDKNADKGPKTLQEIHDEQQKKEQESAKISSRGRAFMGRSDGNKNNNFNVAGDLSKIGRIRSQGVGQPTLGPTSLNRDLSGSNGSRKSASPGVPLSKEPSLSSRTPSQSQRSNIFEHLNDDDSKLESDDADKEAA